MSSMDTSGVDIRIIQIAWALLILAGPALCWLCGRVIGIAGTPLLDRRRGFYGARHRLGGAPRR